MKVIAFIDAPILWIVERFAHFIQRTFGVPPINLARFCYAVWIIATVAEDIQRKRGWLAYFYVPLVLLVYVFGFDVEMQNREREAIDGLRNSEKLSNAALVVRVMLAALCACPPYQIHTPALTLCFYFRACDQLPPGMSRVRKWWSAISTVMQPAQESV